MLRDNSHEEAVYRRRSDAACHLLGSRFRERQGSSHSPADRSSHRCYSFLLAICPQIRDFPWPCSLPQSICHSPYHQAFKNDSVLRPPHLSRPCRKETAAASPPITSHFPTILLPMIYNHLSWTNLREREWNSATLVSIPPESA